MSLFFILLITGAVVHHLYYKEPSGLASYIDSTAVLAVVEEHLPFYHRLPSGQQKIFLDRTADFIVGRTWIPRNMKEVTFEMKVLVAAHAVQICFGYPTITLSHFDKVIIYAGEYRSQKTGRWHKGEVNPGGAIVLAWDHAMKGVHVPDDGINLLLHELAHAIQLENSIGNGDWNFIPEGKMDAFNRKATVIMEEIKAGRSPLREYAATNRVEFFAVVVEHFFERPDELYEHHPALFQLTAEILRQPQWLQLYRA